MHIRQKTERGTLNRTVCNVPSRTSNSWGSGKGGARLSAQEPMRSVKLKGRQWESCSAPSQVFTKRCEQDLTTVLTHSTDTTEKELIAAIKLWPHRNSWAPINPGKWQPGVSDAVEWALAIQLQQIVESDRETLLHVGPFSQARQTIPAALSPGWILVVPMEKKTWLPLSWLC